MPKVDLDEFRKAAEEGHGCKLRDMLTDIPAEEHLSIIREFKRNELNNPAIDVQIVDGSKESNFEFAIYQKSNKSGSDTKSKLDELMDQANKKNKKDPIFREIYANRGGFVAIHNRKLECRDTGKASE